MAVAVNGSAKAVTPAEWDPSRTVTARTESDL
jgi:hypothetical protein